MERTVGLSSSRHTRLLHRGGDHDHEDYYIIKMGIFCVSTYHVDSGCWLRGSSILAYFRIIIAGM